MDDANRTRAMNPSPIPGGGTPQPTQTLTASGTTSGSAEPTQALPISSQTGADADKLLADQAKRRQIEMDLARLGMSPDEVRRLLNADSKDTDPIAKQQSAAGLPSPPPVAPVALPNLPNMVDMKAMAKGKAPKVSAGALSSYASELLASRAQAQIRKVEHVALGLAEFRQSTVQEKLQAETLLREATALRRREKYVEAEIKCREALTFAPKDAAGLELLGDIYQGVARIDEALACYRRAVEADPKRASSERKYGELLMQQQNWSSVDMEDVPRNALFATLLSLLFPGGGQFHNGEINKGVFFLVLDAICLYLVAFSPWGFAGAHGKHGLNISLLACLLITFVVYVFSAADAYQTARNGRQRGGADGWDV